MDDFMYANFSVAFAGTQTGFRLCWRDDQQKLKAIDMMRSFVQFCLDRQLDDSSEETDLHELMSHLQDLKHLEELVLGGQRQQAEPTPHEKRLPKVVQKRKTYLQSVGGVSDDLQTPSRSVTACTSDLLSAVQAAQAAVQEVEKAGLLAPDSDEEDEDGRAEEMDESEVMVTQMAWSDEEESNFQVLAELLVEPGRAGGSVGLRKVGSFPQCRYNLYAIPEEEEDVTPQRLRPTPPAGHPLSACPRRQPRSASIWDDRALPHC
mmetsp:Transcript_23547/g.42481  ORF Transcript_23547/g.42481 Transcript_23547/m.42481 type:complete len:263 (+) Transcript_23547:57-845(+)